MIDQRWCRLMAAYNTWMNGKLYAACSAFSDDELRRERGAFFGSVFASLNHILYGDLAFLSRLTGEPARMPKLGETLHPDFHSLRCAREALDARIVDWCGSLQNEWLAGDLSYTSNVDGKLRTLPRWLIVTHLFNHQTHHRGQITTLLSQCKIDVGSTDLPFMPEVEATLR